MKKATLVREKLTSATKCEFGEDLQALAIKSKLVLGYNVLHGFVTPKKTLREILLALGIAPFSRRSVEAYKAEKLKKANSAAKDEDSDESFRWRSQNIRSYRDPIPEFVLNKAIQVQEALPEASIHVEQLTTARPDPFLIVLHGEERYYIEVWDEPAFEHKLLNSMITKFDDDDEADD